MNRYMAIALGCLALVAVGFVGGLLSGIHHKQAVADAAVAKAAAAELTSQQLKAQAAQAKAKADEMAVHIAESNKTIERLDKVVTTKRSALPPMPPIGQRTPLEEKQNEVIIALSQENDALKVQNGQLKVQTLNLQAAYDFQAKALEKSQQAYEIQSVATAAYRQAMAKAELRDQLKGGVKGFFTGVVLTALYDRGHR